MPPVIEPVVAFVFRPGDTARDNVYTDWPTLVTRMENVQGRKILEFDDSLIAPAPCAIPAGSWNMKDVVWAGFGPRPGATRPLVAITDGAELKHLRMIGGQITIDNQVKSGPSPVSDFVDDVPNELPAANHFHIGMRDDCGNTQLFNSGTVPMFNLKKQSTGTERTVLFFCQNCLLNMRYRKTIAPAPPQEKNYLITYDGEVKLTINFIGQNQTGEKLVRPPATARFGALSSSTQIAASNINNSGNEFGPVTRIQRRVQPRPPKVAAKAHLQPNNPNPPEGELGQIALPNALLRCDGNGTNGSGFTVRLPKIVGGFSFGMNDPTFLYTGGQEIVVAEIKGGANLRVQAWQGSPKSDTINDSDNPVSIPANQSRTFASDGLDNWIMIVGD